MHKVGVDVSQLDVFTCSRKLVCIENLGEGEADSFLCEVIPFTRAKGILCVWVHGISLHCNSSRQN